MRTSSAKAKGRRASAETKELLLKYAPDLRPDDIVVTPSGVPGPDLHFSPKAREKFNLVVETKNVEKLNMWEAFKQTLGHLVYAPNSIPTLFYRRNRSDLMVTLRAEDFVKLIS